MSNYVIAVSSAMTGAGVANTKESWISLITVDFQSQNPLHVKFLICIASRGSGDLTVSFGNKKTHVMADKTAISSFDPDSPSHKTDQ